MKYPIISYNPILRERARELRRRMTPGERKLWQYLKGKKIRGYDFDRQRPIDRFIVDFYCKALELAIEIDGASHNGPAAAARDRARQTRLEAFGISFLRFSEGAALHQTGAVAAAIGAWIDERTDARGEHHQH